ncbi:pilus assembly protein PilP [Corallococcus soli]|nr:pilus assembly protein PilP [Corallococcus soli]
MKTFKSTMTAAVLVLTLSACGETPKASNAPAKPKTAAPAVAPVTAKAGVTTVPGFVYTYSPVGKRDPFRSPLEELGPITGDGAERACNEPLCVFDLDQLRLVAVVTGDSSPLAMVEDPLGRGHIVRRNTRMGRQGGKVTQILRDSVTVTEVFTGAKGELISNPVSLQLKADGVKDPAYNLMTGKNWE